MTGRPINHRVPSRPFSRPGSRVAVLPVFLLFVVLCGCAEQAGDKDLVSYVSDLRKDDFLQRLAAAKELSLIAGESDVVAVPYLIESLKEPRELIQRSSAQALGRIRCYSAIPALIEGSRDDNDYVRYDCVVALGGLDDPRVHKPLIAALNDDSTYVRWAAAEALGDLRVAEAYPWLINALRDNSSYVRTGAANALGKLGDPQAVTELSSSLYDRNYWVRNASARALARLGENEGIPVLISNLESNIVDRDNLVRAQAAEFLREVTGQNFGFDPEGSPAARQEALRRWQEWWASQR